MAARHHVRWIELEIPDLSDDSKAPACVCSWAWAGEQLCGDGKPSRLLRGDADLAQVLVTSAQAVAADAAECSASSSSDRPPVCSMRTTKSRIPFSICFLQPDGRLTGC